MEASDWHLGLRAWNVGPPPFADEDPLSPLELELTEWFASLRSHPIEAPLLGERGVLGDQLGQGCPTLLEIHADEAATILSGLAEDWLGDVEGSIVALLVGVRSEIEGRPPTDVVRRSGLKRAASAIADGAVAINIAAPISPLRGLVLTSWIVAVAARCSAGVAVRERRHQLVALEREVQRSCDEMGGTPPQDAVRLATHIYADMLKADRRVH